MAPKSHENVFFPNLDAVCGWGTWRPDFMCRIYMILLSWLNVTFDANGHPVNTLRLRKNDCQFPDDNFKCIVLNEYIYKISLKFVFKGPINSFATLVQIMAWRRPGDKPLFEPMMFSVMTHICVTRPQWVNKYGPTAPQIATTLGTTSIRYRSGTKLSVRYIIDFVLRVFVI